MKVSTTTAAGYSKLPDSVLLWRTKCVHESEMKKCSIGLWMIVKASLIHKELCSSFTLIQHSSLKWENLRVHRVCGHRQQEPWRSNRAGSKPSFSDVCKRCNLKKKIVSSSQMIRQNYKMCKALGQKACWY